MLYRAALFDLDGTLLNTLDDLTCAVNHALSESGCPVRTKAQVRASIGQGVRHLIQTSLPAGAPADLQEHVFLNFRSYYAQHYKDATTPYEGIPALLRHLRTRGIRCAVISNKSDVEVQKLINHFFPGEFDAVVGEQADAGIRKKPAPDLVNLTLEQLDMKPKDALYIGDSDTDIETAKNAQCDCASVTWGYRSREFLRAHGATTLVDNPQELEHLITGEEVH